MNWKVRLDLGDARGISHLRHHLLDLGRRRIGSAVATPMTIPWSFCGASSDCEFMNRNTVPAKIIPPMTTITIQVSSVPCRRRW
ncbi:hypothetical protein [Dokdonella sp.]|uniref:hypothetical protein n=1 Tax=Dokdonella sp. TaxID=2291710 RepID=UPI00352975DE